MNCENKATWWHPNYDVAICDSCLQQSFHYDLEDKFRKLWIASIYHSTLNKLIIEECVSHSYSKTVDDISCTTPLNPITIQPIDFLAVPR